MGLPTGTTAEISALIPANLGSIAYSTDDNVILQYNGTAWVVAGDNLGNHTATQNIEISGNYISGDGDNEGLTVNDDGQVGISNQLGFIPQRQLHVSGTNGGIRLDRFGNDAFLFFVNLNAAGNTVLQNWAFVNGNNIGGGEDFEIRNYGTLVSGPGNFTPLRIKTNNQLQLDGYNLAGNAFNDNTVTKILGVQDDGDVVRVDVSSLGGGASSSLRVFEAYDNTGGSVANEGTGFNTLNLDTVRTNQSGFTLASDAVTIPETGIYEINYSTTFSAGSNQNSVVETRIFINGTAVDGSSTFIALTDTGEDSTASKNIIISLTSGDQITLRSQREGSAQNTATTETDGTNITIKKLD